MTEGEQKELKPCPFCGNDKLKVIERKMPENSWIDCPVCEVVLESATNEPFENLLNRWNTRFDTRWKPIRSEDDLPKENGFYLATLIPRKITVAVQFYDGEWFAVTDPEPQIPNEDVSAWMPLPAAYEGGE